MVEGVSQQQANKSKEPELFNAMPWTVATLNCMLWRRRDDDGGRDKEVAVEEQYVFAKIIVQGPLLFPMQLIAGNKTFVNDCWDMLSHSCRFVG